MKNKDWGRGLNREGGLINFPPLKKRGGAYLRGGLNRGFNREGELINFPPLKVGGGGGLSREGGLI